MCPVPAQPYPEPMGAVRGDLIDAVCRELANAGDPERARGQQAYMKSTMPFRGVTAPQLKATLRPVLADPAYRLVGARRVGGDNPRTLGCRPVPRGALCRAGHLRAPSLPAVGPGPLGHAAVPLSGRVGGVVGLRGRHRRTPGRPGPESAPRNRVGPDALLGDSRQHVGAPGGHPQPALEQGNRPTDSSFSTASRPTWPTRSSSPRYLASRSLRRCARSPRPPPGGPPGSVGRGGPRPRPTPMKRREAPSTWPGCRREQRGPRSRHTADTANVRSYGQHLVHPEPVALEGQRRARHVQPPDPGPAGAR